MINRNYQQIASKIRKTEVLLADPDVKRFIPETQMYSFEKLEEMLEKYRTVYAKPNIGSYGIGVVRIERLENGEFKVNHGAAFKTFPSLIQVQDALKPFTEKRAYLLQQGIELLEIEGNPVDLRVMVQKPNGEWKVSGVAAKMAGRNRVVTNYHADGIMLPFAVAMQKSLGLSKGQIGHLWQQIQTCCLTATKVLVRTFPGMKELGYDLGIDRHLRIWIIEVNTRPGYGIFKKLGDKEMYRRLLTYNRQL